MCTDSTSGAAEHGAQQNMCTDICVYTRACAGIYVQLKAAGIGAGFKAAGLSTGFIQCADSKATHDTGKY